MHMEILEELLRMGEVGRGDCEGEIGGGGRKGWGFGLATHILYLPYY